MQGDSIDIIILRHKTGDQWHKSAEGRQQELGREMEGRRQREGGCRNMPSSFLACRNESQFKNLSQSSFSKNWNFNSSRPRCRKNTKCYYYEPDPIFYECTQKSIT